MAAWYVSDVVYNALTAWAPAHAITSGALRKRASGADKTNLWVFQAGGSGTTGSTEPAWPTANNGTVVDNGITWTNISGQTKAAAAGSISSLTSGVDGSLWGATADIFYVRNDYNGADDGNNVFNWFVTNNYGRFVSCVFSGSTPPAAADYTPGAVMNIDSATTLYFQGPVRMSGISIKSARNGSNAFIVYTPNPMFIEDATLTLTGTITNIFNGGNATDLRLRNVTCTPSAAPNAFYSAFSNGTLSWENSGVAAWGNTNWPVYLLSGSNSSKGIAEFTGLDLSSFNGSSFFYGQGGGLLPIQVSDCKLPATLYTGSTIGTPAWLYTVVGDTYALDTRVTYKNCSSANNNYMNGMVTARGYIGTDTTNYLTGGTTDGVTPYSLKFTTAANPYTTTLDNSEPIYALPMVANVSNPGTPQTATVQLCSDTALTQEDAVLEITYPGSASNCTSKLVVSRGPLANAALPTGSGTWTSPPGSPHYYELQVTFTPQAVGIAVGRIAIATQNVNVWYSPMLVGVA